MRARCVTGGVAIRQSVEQPGPAGNLFLKDLIHGEEEQSARQTSTSVRHITSVEGCA